jgi:hypothetical protein
MPRAVGNIAVCGCQHWPRLRWLYNDLGRVYAVAAWRYHAATEMPGKSVVPVRCEVGGCHRCAGAVYATPVK